MFTIFCIIILALSIIIHEISHGFAALSQGDATAKYAGRLTLNPISHIDPFGTVILPLLMAFSGLGVVFGWAKPVPYNPYNLRNGRWSELWVAFAGPLSNIVLAVVCGLFLRFYGLNLPQGTIDLLGYTVLVNIGLACFNLVPLPPLDGSKILFSLLPQKTMEIRAFLEKYGFILTIFFIFFLWEFCIPFVLFLFKLITGTGLN
jgi:Zn-dependent protease